MKKDKLFNEKVKVDNKIDELKGQRKKLDEKINKIKKREEEKKKKEGEEFYANICNVYTDLLSKYDIESQIYYEYWDDYEGGDREMVKKLVDDGYENEFYATELPYDTEEIIDEKIKSAKSFAQAMNNHVKLLEEFKKQILKNGGAKCLV